jgi:hypothetical protein
MIIQWYRTIWYGMVWYGMYDTSCTGMIPVVLQDDFIDSSSMSWALCTGAQTVSSLIWALCTGAQTVSYNMSSVYRSSNCELFDMSSVYRSSHSELFDMSSVYRSPNCELYNMSSVYRSSNCELFDMSSLYPGSLFMSSVIWALSVSRITNFEFRIMSSLILLQTSCVSWPSSHEFCDMITVSRARWYLPILVLATYSMDIYNSIILNFNELILAVCR